MKNILAAILIGVALAILQQVAMAQSDESDSPGVAYVRCVAAAAQRLDDRVSDAQTIAIGADVVCDKAKRNLVLTFLQTKKINPNSIVGLNILNEHLANHSQATSIVLTMRANAASK